MLILIPVHKDRFRQKFLQEDQMLFFLKNHHLRLRLGSMLGKVLMFHNSKAKLKIQVK